MIFFYILSNSVAVAIPNCYWYEWSNWGPSSTCGQVCKHRKRDLCVVDWDELCLGTEGNYYDSCPWHETQTVSCETITCRELIF